MNVMRSVLLAGSQNPWLRRQATTHKFVRKAVSRFMPGESVEDAIQAAQRLGESGISTILTQLGENVTDASEASEVVEHYVHVLERIHLSRLDAEISIKPTQLGLDLSMDMAMNNLERIVLRAEQFDNRVWIDMEATPYTDATLELFRTMKSRHANLGVCLQAYLKRTKADLETLIPMGPAIRVVKGAYQEPADLVLPSKRDVDQSFFAMTRRLMAPDAKAAGAFAALGTHDPKLITRIEQHVEEEAIEREQFEFTMLFGIQRPEQVRLARAGYGSRVLISYGSHWFPWYMRRLAERPANVLFVLKSMVGG